ncbi:A-kinase anchor protein 17A [Balamuthia mandrillaris]
MKEEEEEARLEKEVQLLRLRLKAQEERLVHGLELLLRTQNPHLDKALHRRAQAFLDCLQHASSSPQPLSLVPSPPSASPYDDHAHTEELPSPSPSSSNKTKKRTAAGSHQPKTKNGNGSSITTTSSSSDQPPQQSIFPLPQIASTPSITTTPTKRPNNNKLIEWIAAAEKFSGWDTQSEGEEAKVLSSLISEDESEAKDKVVMEEEEVDKTSVDWFMSRRFPPATASPNSKLTTPTKTTAMQPQNQQGEEKEKGGGEEEQEKEVEESMKRMGVSMNASPSRLSWGEERMKQDREKIRQEQEKREKMRRQRQLIIQQQIKEEEEKEKAKAEKEEEEAKKLEDVQTITTLKKEKTPFEERLERAEKEKRDQQLQKLKEERERETATAEEQAILNQKMSERERELLRERELELEEKREKAKRQREKERKRIEKERRRQERLRLRAGTASATSDSENYTSMSEDERLQDLLWYPSGEEDRYDSEDDRVRRLLMADSEAGGPPSIVYQPVTSDPVDVKLGELLKELGFVKEVLAIPPNFERLSTGSYQFGAKKIRVELQGGTNRLMVRVGGGWMSFLDFVKKHGEMECKKIQAINNPFKPH